MRGVKYSVVHHRSSSAKFLSSNAFTITMFSIVNLAITAMAYLQRLLSDNLLHQRDIRTQIHILQVVVVVVLLHLLHQLEGSLCVLAITA